MTNIRLSSQQTNSMHPVRVSYWAPLESLPVSLPLGVNVHRQRLLAFPFCVISVLISLKKQDSLILLSSKPSRTLWERRALCSSHNVTSLVYIVFHNQNIITMGQMFVSEILFYLH